MSNKLQIVISHCHILFRRNLSSLSSTSSAAACSDDSTDVVVVNVFINLPVEFMGFKSDTRKRLSMKIHIDTATVK